MLKRMIALLLGAALLAGLIAAPSGAAGGAGSSPTASAAKKKCKKKSAAKKKHRKCKKKRATPRASISITPPSTDYGSLATGTATNPSDFVIRNNGGSISGQPTASLSGANPGQFQISGTSCNTPLPPGIACAVSVAFAPTTFGAHTASLDVIAAPGGAVHAALVGTGTGPAALAIMPSSGHAFGNGYTGFNSVPAGFTIKNVGGVDSGTPIISFGGADPGQFLVSSTDCTGPLVPTDGCSVNVVFHPTSNGAKSASLNVSATPGGSASSAPLTGTGVTDIAISPTTQNYGLHLAGTTTTQTFTITNNGASPTGPMSAAFIGGTSATDYSVPGPMNNCTGNSVPASGGTCTFDVVFKPRVTGSPQLRTSAGTVTIRGNPGGQVTATLAGTVLEL